MKTRKYNNFSLLELCIAIAIFAIGAAAVVTMIPVGVKENRESVGTNYSTIFAEDMYSYITKKVSEDWNFLNNLPLYKSSYQLSGATTKWQELNLNIAVKPA